MRADHKVLREGFEYRINQRYAFAVQHAAAQRIQSYPCKTRKLLRIHKGACRNSWSRTGSLNTFHWQFFGIWQGLWRSFLESLYVKHKKMGLLRGQCAEWKKGHLRRSCSPVWVTNGGRILWCVTAIGEPFKISRLMGRHHLKGASECHFTDQQYCLEQSSNITHISAEIPI